MKHMHYGLTPAQLGKLGCDNAPSSMTGHSGRCKSAQDHEALLHQGIGMGRNPTGSSTTANDHGRPEMRPR